MITKEYSNLDKLIDLACNSFEMLDFLRINRPDEIYLVDNKCGIFSIPKIDSGDVLKFIVHSKGDKAKYSLDPQLQEIVKRGLRAQMVVQGIEGVQVLRQLNFYEGVVGLLGPFEYLQGSNLSHITDPELHDYEKVLELFKELDDNLEKIHQKEIIHGDIKPGNIIHSDGKLVLIDWSTARTFEEDSNYSGPLIATMRYFYPLSDRSRDYWALSLTFVDVLRGRIILHDNEVRDGSEDLVETLARRLRQRLGKEYGDFYKDLANRKPEVDFKRISSSRIINHDDILRGIVEQAQTTNVGYLTPNRK